jgi:hypothetical protein
MHYAVESYTDRFDCQHYPIDNNRRTYMVATIPRTGSTYLCHRLWRTGCMGVPLEYLNPVF